MPHDPFTRRLITVPAVALAFVVITAAAPVLAVVGLVVDIVRAVTSGKPWMSLRILAFAWTYLAGEVLALAALGVTALLPGAAKLTLTYRLQDLWTAWNLGALRLFFSIGLDVAGAGDAAPGPVIVLSIHASLVDTMLPARLIARPHRLRLRYVLKSELLVDPTLDIAGHRLPNGFIERSGDSAELAVIRDLAGGLGRGDGVLIYPEGTRFSEEKLARQARRAIDRGGRLDELTLSYRRVLAPRPAGTLALLESTGADVVVFAHRGLHGMASVADIWRGGFVGSRVEVAIWRVPRGEVPNDRSERVEWLFRLWAEIDEWVSGDQTTTPPSL